MDSFNIKFHVTLLLSSLLMSAAVAQLPTEPDLGPEALECYKQVMENPEILKNLKRLTLGSRVQEVAISMCTYSDAAGAQGCYMQALSKSDVLPMTKRVASFEQEELIYARLCSNSHASNINAETRDFDAIDCVIGVQKDNSVLSALREYSGASSFEQDLVNLCISSNAKGATTCYKNAKEASSLYPTFDYQTASRFDKVLIQQCRASRLR